MPSNVVPPIVAPTMEIRPPKPKLKPRPPPPKPNPTQGIIIGEDPIGNGQTNGQVAGIMGAGSGTYFHIYILTFRKCSVKIRSNLFDINS